MLIYTFTGIKVNNIFILLSFFLDSSVENAFCANIVHGLVVSASSVEDVEDLREDVVGAYIVEECHAGGELQPVGISHQLPGIPRRLVEHSLGYLPQVGVERFILQIGPGFIEGAEIHWEGKLPEGTKIYPRHPLVRLQT